MAKELAKKEETSLAEFSNFANTPKMDTLSSMIKLPRLSIMQKTSKPVEDDKAKIGDMFENLGNTVVCAKDKPFRFVPLVIKPVITTYTEENGRPKYLSHVEMSSNNQRYDWDAGQRGEIHLYLLAAEDLGNPIAMPYIFTVKGMNMKTFGKALYTYAQLFKAAKQHPFTYIFSMTNKKEENEKGSFQVAYVDKPSEKVGQEFYGQIDQWLTTLNSMNNIVVDHDDAEIDPAKTGETPF